MVSHFDNPVIWQVAGEHHSQTPRRDFSFYLLSFFITCSVRGWGLMLVLALALVCSFAFWSEDHFSLFISAVLASLRSHWSQMFLQNVFCHVCWLSEKGSLIKWNKKWKHKNQLQDELALSFSLSRVPLHYASVPTWPVFYPFVASCSLLSTCLASILIQRHVTSFPFVELFMSLHHSILTRMMKAFSSY